MKHDWEKKICGSGFSLCVIAQGKLHIFCCPPLWGFANEANISKNDVEIKTGLFLNVVPATRFWLDNGERFFPRFFPVEAHR